MMGFARYRVLAGVAGLLVLPLTTAFQEAGEDTSPAAEAASPAVPSEDQSLSPNDPAITSLPGAFQYVGQYGDLEAEDYNGPEFSLYRRPTENGLTEFYEIPADEAVLEETARSFLVRKTGFMGGFMLIEWDTISDHKRLSQQGDGKNNFSPSFISDFRIEGEPVTPMQLKARILALEEGETLFYTADFLSQIFGYGRVEGSDDYTYDITYLGESCLDLPVGRLPVKKYRRERIYNTYYWAAGDLLVQTEIAARGSIPAYSYRSLMTVSDALRPLVGEGC